MPSRVPGSRNLRFNRRFPEPVGRIVNSSGTSDPAKFAEYDLLLTKLWRADQVEVLLAFKRGEIAMAEIAEADREKGLAKADLLAGLKLRKNLWTAIEALFPEKPGHDTTRGRYYTSLRALRRIAPYYVGGAGRLDAQAAVRDLRRVDWPRLRTWWLAPVEEGGRGASGTDWMHLRRAVSWCLTQITGDRYNEHRRAIMALIATAEEDQREPDLTPEEFWAITDRVTPAVKAALITFAVSGLRGSEYQRCTKFHLKPAEHRIMVPGRKGASKGQHSVVVAAEYWPYVEAAIPAQRTVEAIYRAFKRAARAIGKGDLTLHDLRHCFVQWGLDEGAPIPAAQKAARHGDVRMTMRYAARREKGVMGEAVGRALTKGRKHA